MGLFLVTVACLSFFVKSVASLISQFLVASFQSHFDEASRSFVSSGSFILACSVSTSTVFSVLLVKSLSSFSFVLFSP